MRNHSWLALLLTASIGSPMSADDGAPPTDRWNEAWASGDASALGALHTENARVMTPNFPAKVGRTVIEEMYGGMIERGMVLHATVLEDLSSGDLWVRRTDFTMSMLGQQIDDGEAVEVWRRVDGDWLLELEIFTSRNIRPIAYDDPAPEYDRIIFRDKEPDPDSQSEPPPDRLYEDPPPR